MKSNHIYWYGINKSPRSIFAKEIANPTNTTDYIFANNILLASIFSFIGFLVFEFLMLLGGVSIMFSSLIFLQNFFHFLGCLFTIWFLLDDW